MACEFPYMVDNPKPMANGGFHKIPVPCGKCYDCKMRTVSQWAFRLRKESEVSTSAYFVTLTYDTNHVPISPKGFMTLKKKDLQDWMKRLRKLHTQNEQIKYFAVGEYGSKRFRPHYHVIVFNAAKPHIFSSWMLDSHNLGGVHIGAVSGASLAYTLKYMMKESKIPVHQNDDRVKEFRVMSKKMGINYLTPQVKKWHRADYSRLYTLIEDGIKVALPRYYREKIWNTIERQKQNLEIIDKFQKIKDEKERKFRSDTGKDLTEQNRRIAERKTKRMFRDSEGREDL